MTIFPAPDRILAQMWSNGVRETHWWTEACSTANV